MSNTMADSIHQALEALDTIDSGIASIVRKTFIARLFTETDMSPDELKAELVRQHQWGAVVLSRCDMVAAFDPELVAASEARFENATFHFIEW